MTKAFEKKIYTCLNETELFSWASEQDLLILSKEFSEIKHFKKNENIFFKGSTEKCIGIILKGEAIVTKEYIVISQLKKNQLFGTVTLYNNDSEFVNNIIAKSDCDVVFISKNGIDYLISKSPKFAKKYIEYLSKRIYFLNHKIESYTMPTAEEKLYNYIACLSKEKTFNLNINMTDLAKQLNLSRASLYRAFDELIKQGRIDKKGKTINLL